MLAYTFDIPRLIFTALRISVIFDLLIFPSGLIASVEGSIGFAPEDRPIGHTFGLATQRW
jgi:hypothetical protein